MRLDGKRVVVIGGSSGIGLETARLALSLGAHVTIAGRSEDRLSRAAATLKNVRDRLRTVVADMADGQSIQSLFSGESQVDHVFVPAGEFRPESADLLTGDIAGMRSILEVRLFGLAHVVRHTKPLMKNGSFVLISGLYAKRPAAGGAMAAAAVAAVEGMTRALALDLAPDPGECRSPWPDRHSTLGHIRSATRSNPCKRVEAAGRTRRTSRGDRRSRCVSDDQRIRHRSRSTGRWWWKPRLRDSLAFCDETSQRRSGYHSHCRNPASHAWRLNCT